MGSRLEPGGRSREGAASFPHRAVGRATLCFLLALSGGAQPGAVGAESSAVDRGLVEREERVRIVDATGSVIWDTAEYDFIAGGAPPTVEAGLWRRAADNNKHGLYRVAEGVHQVRGYDLSNLTVIEGREGRIVVDPLTSEETAAAAMALVEKALGRRPVSAVIFTHSHADHFGGVGGVAAPEVLASVPIVAPAGFLEAATSENVLAGLVMGRRAELMYGRSLARGPRGHVDSGLGKAPAFGTIGIASPTVEIGSTPTELVLDGVRLVFQYAPGTEAPAELVFYLPHVKALCGAEIVSRTLHNLYTPRGAPVRDALAWSAAIDAALERFGGEAEVLFASHHWPTWGREAVVATLARQRDVYKYLHDQTLRLANRGLTPREIAEELVLPPELATADDLGGYYGTVSHNSKAIYQRYFGWYDGNPSNLEPHPPATEARRYVSLMGGVERVVEHARAAFEEGDLRWAATLLAHVVFAEPDHADARELLARVYDGLGFAARSGPWRDIYLSGAHELRHGVTRHPPVLAAAAEMLAQTPTARFLETLATRLDGPSAAGRRLTINLVLEDVGETWVLELGNAVLHSRERPPNPAADATLTLERAVFVAMMTGRLTPAAAFGSGLARVEGGAERLLELFALLEAPDPHFALVVP